MFACRNPIASPSTSPIPSAIFGFPTQVYSPAASTFPELTHTGTDHRRQLRVESPWRWTSPCRCRSCSVLARETVEGFLVVLQTERREKKSYSSLQYFPPVLRHRELFLFPWSKACLWIQEDPRGSSRRSLEKRPYLHEKGTTHQPIWLIYSKIFWEDERIQTSESYWGNIFPFFWFGLAVPLKMTA